MAATAVGAREFYDVHGLPFEAAIRLAGLSLNVSTTGKRCGTEVVQLYAADTATGVRLPAQVTGEGPLDLVLCAGLGVAPRTALGGTRPRAIPAQACVVFTAHIGARVAGIANGGETLVSSTVKDLVSGSGLRFDDRGTHALKGVPGEWRLYAASG